MTFKWAEIRKWAAQHNQHPKKVGDEYVWEEGTYKSLETLTKAIYNHISNNKFVDHQKNHAAQK